MIIKNQSIVIRYYAWNTSNNSPRTGDAANHTLRLVQDDGSPAAPANSPSEVDATNCPGLYKLTLTAAETNFDSITLAGKSSTGNTRIQVEHLFTYTKVGYSLADASIVAATFGAGAITEDVLATSAVTKISDGIFSHLIDGVSFEDISEFILAYTTGKIVRDVDDYTYMKQDGITPLYTLRSAPTLRTRIA